MKLLATMKEERSDADKKPLSARMATKEEKKTMENFIAFRPTFGIIDHETGKRYKDIILSFLHPHYITCQDFDNGFIWHNGQQYRLHCDKRVRIELGMEGYCKVLISFQIRTTGAYAIARVYNENEGK
jgi:hypothetical protein